MTALPGWPCEVCRRSAGEITINKGGTLAMLCSDTCAQIYLRTGPVTGDEIERKSIEAGGHAAGEYLDRIGKTDLATLTADQWQMFCMTLYRETCAQMRALADDEIPF